MFGDSASDYFMLIGDAALAACMAGTSAGVSVAAKAAARSVAKAAAQNCLEYAIKSCPGGEEALQLKSLYDNIKKAKDIDPQDLKNKMDKAASMVRRRR
jgi:D-mannonate dehydratase